MAEPKTRIIEVQVKCPEVEELVNDALDEFKYKGRTLRQWADSIVNPKTNADRIRSFSDEEMAEFLDGATNCYCFPCTRDINNLEHYEKCKHESGNCEKEWLEWLKGEADEDQT